MTTQKAIDDDHAPVYSLYKKTFARAVLRNRGGEVHSDDWRHVQFEPNDRLHCQSCRNEDEEQVEEEVRKSKNLLLVRDMCLTHVDDGDEEDGNPRSVFAAQHLWHSRNEWNHNEKRCM